MGSYSLHLLVLVKLFAVHVPNYSLRALVSHRTPEISFVYVMLLSSDDETNSTTHWSDDEATSTTDIHSVLMT